MSAATRAAPSWEVKKPVRKRIFAIIIVIKYPESACRQQKSFNKIGKKSLQAPYGNAEQSFNAFR